MDLSRTAKPVAYETSCSWVGTVDDGSEGRGKVSEGADGLARREGSEGYCLRMGLLSWSAIVAVRTGILFCS